MDAAIIQAKINYGYGKAAQYLGVACNWYRPTSTAFIDPSTLQGTVQAYFDSSPQFTAAKPSSFAHPASFVAVDRTDLQTSDYLVKPSGETYFINIIEALAPTSSIECNAVVTVFRSVTATSGAPYQMVVTNNGDIQVANCPCSILQGTKGEADHSGVEMTPRMPWVAIVMPNLPTVQLYVGDIMIDDKGRRYNLSSIEQSDLGMRITAEYSST
jgi:hypothetical protein